MIAGSLSEWATAMDGRLLGPDRHFAGVSTDSRSPARGALFFALRGERFDGADFLSAAVSGGATGAVLSRPLPEDVAQIIVKDTRGALADCARTWRRRFDIPVIGVTGSNGKTTVKELTASILRAHWGEEAVLASPRSFNNEIGLPLTLLDLSGRHNAAVLEIGANRPGEIASLSEIARPTIGALLNASPAHLEGLGDVENIAREKGGSDVLPGAGRSGRDSLRARRFPATGGTCWASGPSCGSAVTATSAPATPAESTAGSVSSFIARPA